MGVPVIDPESDDFVVECTPRAFSSGDSLRSIAIIGASNIYVYPPDWENSDPISAVATSTFGETYTYTIPNSAISIAGVYRATFYFLLGNGTAVVTDWIDLFEVRELG